MQCACSRCEFQNWITPLGLTLWKVKGFPDCGCYCKFIYSNMQGRRRRNACLPVWFSVYGEGMVEAVRRWNERSCYMQLNFRFFKRKLKRNGNIGKMPTWILILKIAILIYTFSRLFVSIYVKWTIFDLPKMSISLQFIFKLHTLILSDILFMVLYCSRSISSTQFLYSPNELNDNNAIVFLWSASLFFACYLPWMKGRNIQFR